RAEDEASRFVYGSGTRRGRFVVCRGRSERFRRVQRTKRAASSTGAGRGEAASACAEDEASRFVACRGRSEPLRLRGTSYRVGIVFAVSYARRRRRVDQHTRM